jgi:hypothetical protein
MIKNRGDLMEKLNIKEAALSTGVVFALLHTTGVFLVRTRVWNFIEWIHSFKINLELTQITAASLVSGILTAFVVGCIIGTVFVLVHNKLHK